MGKGRFTALDVCAMVTSLRPLIVGMRVANIYDLNSRTYLIKLSGKDKRKYLILESGNHFHVTNYERIAAESDSSKMPNHFASKLRKYLKSKRLANIEQLNRDRIVMFSFGEKYRLILELFAGGNIILTDYAQHTIILCLRVHHDSKSNINIVPGTLYPHSAHFFSSAQPAPPPLDDSQFIASKLRKCVADYLLSQQQQQQQQRHTQSTAHTAMSNRQKRKRKMNHFFIQTVRDFVIKTMSISPMIADCIMNKCHIENPQEALLNYVLPPYPVLCPPRKQRHENEDDEEEEEEDEDETQASMEDAMYANMSSEEKTNAMKLDDDKFERLMECFKEFECLLHSLQSNVSRGYIISKRIASLPMKQIHIFVKKKRTKKAKPTINLEEDANGSDSVKKRKEEEEEKQPATADADEHKKSETESKEDTKFVYDEFVPYKVDLDDKQKGRMQIDSFATFNECVDEFYSSHEAMKSEQKQSRQEMQALKKLETAKSQHRDRISELTQSMDRQWLFANIIESNLDLVDKAINGVNILLQQGIDWNDLGQRIREEAQYGNPVAAIIVALKLHQSVITLKLKHEIEVEQDDDDAESNDNDKEDSYQASDDESDVSDMFDDDTQQEKTAKVKRCKIKVEYHKIDVELDKSAYNNARKYYCFRKQMLDKKEKTLEATTKAVKAAELKAKAAMQEAQQQKQIAKLRKTYWFEKFFWFISSDNFLVIAGRDAQQNELIVKKYMDKDSDIYVHAQIQGASSVVIKNSRRLKQVPPRTIQEAGQFCVCRSRAWKNNVSIQAYWVYAHQVSKTPPSGQFLPTGSFILRGKRHFIAQQSLTMGVTLLFRIDQKSKQLHHQNERQITYYNAADADDGDHDDVLQQFVANDITSSMSMKKRAQQQSKDEANAVYITKTMIQSNPKARKQFEEKQKDQSKQDKNAYDDDVSEHKKKKSKTDKKLAKYGFVKKDKILSKKEKNKRKKRSKYHSRYDEKDRKLVEQLLGIQPQHDDKDGNQDEDGDEGTKPAANEQEEPAEGYELNANPAITSNVSVSQRQQNDAQNKDEAEDGAEEEEEEEEEEAEEEDEYDKQRRFALCNNLNEELSLLTGRVHEDDVVLYCVAMCAPYSAITANDEYEYKIKIQSGSNKRGKAVKHVYDLFENQMKASPLNDKLDLLSIYKAVKETEINHIFLSDVKLSAPGLKTLQLQQNQIQKKKQKEQWKTQQQLKQNKQKQDNSAINPKKRKKSKK